ncbi:MAG: hypothetical protein HUU15_06605 [Candidatus Brocadiae bacterium]|nr:hypothetical protein [Candidatus Brocadiia bacterium]
MATHTDKPQDAGSGPLARHGFTAVITILGALLLVLVHRSVYAYLQVGDSYTIDLASLHVADRPEWAGDALVGEFRTSGPLTGKMSIFDPDVVRRVTEHYQANPWVARVLSVEKEFPNSLRVKVEMRKPAVAVEVRGRYILVDRERIRIPGEYAQVPRFSFPVAKVLGVRSAAPEPGKVWDDAMVDAGVSVGCALADNRIDRQMTVTGIDVSRVGRGGRESEIVILAEDGVAIEWGRAPAAGKHGELPVDEKILNLKGVLMSQPRLKGVARVKVQFDDPVVITRR